MKDRLPTMVLENGAVRYGVYDESGTLLRYEYIRPEDEPAQVGTPLNKGTLLSDAAVSALGLQQEDPTVSDALTALAGRGGLLRRTVTLTASGWTGSAAPYTQAASVSGILADETKQAIWVTPASGSQTAWDNALVKPSSQAANKLTFQAQKKPASSLTVYVFFMGVNG